MIKALTATTALTLALVLSASGHAQHIGGGLGGGFGGGLGGLGGGLGGGLSTGAVRGELGANGDITNTTVNGAAHANTHVRTPKPPKVTAPTRLVDKVDTHVVTTATGATNRVVATTQTVRPVLERDVTRIAVVPAIPDYAARRVAIYDAGIAPIGYDDAGAYIDNQYQVLQNDLRGTGVDVIRHGQQIVLEMPSDVTFAFNKHDIQPRFQPVLDAVAHTLTKYPATYIDVDGHTDAIGSQAYNQVLSEQRADTVASYLAQRSVVHARMHVEGFGKTEPVASNATVMGRAANRRVEIVLTPYVS
ncbi:OmpA family protein [Novosphingobium sp.]|uniref:OmpA family protein n=1 Tax=Novosphingobium sp. TaxID=1874826 RepID=UPI003D0B27F3